jgi:hypothetical protein
MDIGDAGERNYGDGNVVGGGVLVTVMMHTGDL